LNLNTFLETLEKTPEKIDFEWTMSVIEAHYDFTPVEFVNGSEETPLINEVGANQGSCKIFYFAKLHQLDAESTLNCFGSFYREDVLKKPDASDHQNIRQFMLHGMEGIQFKGSALHSKDTI